MQFKVNFDIWMSTPDDTPEPADLNNWFNDVLVDALDRAAEPFYFDVVDMRSWVRVTDDVIDAGDLLVIEETAISCNGVLAGRDRSLAIRLPKLLNYSKFMLEIGVGYPRIAQMLLIQIDLQVYPDEIIVTWPSLKVAP